MSNKLNLVVNFMGIDKLSGSMKNIMMGSKGASAAMKSLKNETRELERELKDVQRAIAAGSGNMTQLINREKQLEAAVAGANAKLDAQGKRLTRINNIKSKAGAVGGASTAGGAALSVGVTAPLLAFAAQSKDAFLESNDAVMQMEASLASMGRTGEFTSAKLQALAKSEMKRSLYDDDQILRDVTATMLTFGKVQGPIFDRAQAAAVDLSVKFKKDLGSSSVMVGKALQDPVKGVTALTRVGVSFDASQKAMIKSMVAAGNTAGAQRLILAELEKQVAGSAEAARKANPGAAAKQSFDEMQETVGGKLLPVMMKAMTVVGNLADKFNNASPATQQMIIYLAMAAAAAGPLLLGLGGLASVIGMLAGPLSMLSGGAMAAGRAILFVGRAMMMNPIGLLITALAVGAYLIYTYWDQIKAAFNSAVAWLSGLGARMMAIGRNIIMGLVNGIKSAGSAVWTTLKNIVLGGINNIKSFLGIKSPSRVFMALGGYMSEGMALGIDKGGRKALGAAGRLATGVAAAGALSLTPVAAAGPQGRAVGQSAAATASAGGVHIDRLEIVISGANGDPRTLAEQIMRELKKLQEMESRGDYDDG